MSIESLNCQCCGAPLKIGGSICECEYCGTVNFIGGEAGKYINQLNRANKLRQQCEFDRAYTIYDDILSENIPSVDILWSQALCEYGIEYIQDPISSRYHPTLHRFKDISFLNSRSFNEAVELADEKQKEQLKTAAEEIARIQEEYHNIASNEKPYDVFICYKETDDETKTQTKDSEIAKQLYDILTELGLKVFFARVTLQDKIGVNFEPYIFAALKSSTVMVVLGTKAEYFNAVWVRNEWTRFYKLKENDAQKLLLFACNNIEDLPPAFQRKQSQLLTQENAIPNLAYNIGKYMEKIAGENDNLVSATCPECKKIIHVDPDLKASICPQCKKPFIVAEAINKYSNKDRRIKCPFCGRSQEKNVYGCIFCHRKLPE